jgi:peptide deformylase
MSIIQSPNKKLLLKSNEVKKQCISSNIINSIINKMSIELHKTKVGVALSAPQIGYNIRIFIISSKVFGKNNNDMVFINPHIINASKEKVLLDESCLSLQNICGKIERSKIIVLSAYNSVGKLFTIEVTGLLSQIVQHEIDHLDGILFIDKAQKITKCSKSANLQKYSTIKYI